jgi:hypothetical protein
MALTDFHPPLKEEVDVPWSLCVTQCIRSLKQGDEVTVVLIEQPSMGDPMPHAIEKFALTNAETRVPYVDKLAGITGLAPALLDAALMRLYGQVVLAMKKTKPAPQSESYYADDEHGLWLIRPDERGEERIQLTNFRATIVADVLEDDGTATLRRFFEVEASQGEHTGRIRVPAKELQLMHWVPDTLGARARVLPGPYHKEHAHGAIQDLSLHIEHRHTYTHTGWRFLEDDGWAYHMGLARLPRQACAKTSLSRSEKSLRAIGFPRRPLGQTALLRFRKVYGCEPWAPTSS